MLGRKACLGSDGGASFTVSRDRKRSRACRPRLRVSEAPEAQLPSAGLHQGLHPLIPEPTPALRSQPRKDLAVNHAADLPVPQREVSLCRRELLAAGRAQQTARRLASAPPPSPPPPPALRSALYRFKFLRPEEKSCLILGQKPRSDF